MEFNCYNDIYFQEEYANLYIDEDEEIFNFTHKNTGKWLFNISIKRPINPVGKQQTTQSLFDLETAYGYGGICTNTKDEQFVNEAIRKYRNLCFSNNIVAEFFRFHPFNSFPYLFPKHFDFLVKDRPTVVINLKRPYEEIFSDFKSSLRRNIRKANKNGLFFTEMVKSPENIEAFIELYYLTMKRNKATSFYFFSKTYFQKLFQNKYVKLYGVYYKNNLINAGIFLFSPEIIYYHLGASDPNYYFLNGNPLLFAEVCHANVYKYDKLYLGGGNTSRLDDSLFQFKRKFSGETKPFYIGGMIYNKRAYNNLVKLWEKQNPQDNRVFFLKYRLK